MFWLALVELFVEIVAALFRIGVLERRQEKPGKAELDHLTELRGRCTAMQERINHPPEDVMLTAEQRLRAQGSLAHYIQAYDELLSQPFMKR